MLQNITKKHILPIGLVTIAVIVAYVATTLGVYANKPLVVTEHPNKNVAVEYNPSSRAKPAIVIKDTKGNIIKNYSIDVYVGTPYAKLQYIGKIHNKGSPEALISDKVVRGLLNVRLKWLNALHAKSLKGIRPAMLLFIDVPVKVNETTYKVYTFIETVPFNMHLLGKNYKPQIKITVNFSKVKPIVLNIKKINKQLSELKQTRIMKINQFTSQPTQISTIGTNDFNNIPAGGDCDIQGEPTYCSDTGHFCDYVCYEWRLVQLYGSFNDKLVPFIMIRAPSGYPLSPSAIVEHFLAFHFSDSELKWFKLFISVSFLGNIEYKPWTSYVNNYNFECAKAFRNERYSSTYSFLDDAIVALGVKGSGAVGLYDHYTIIYRHYYDIDEWDTYVYDDHEYVNITIFDINTYVDSSGKYIADCSYDVDDILGDGNGLEVLWDIVNDHIQYYDSQERTGSITYVYEGTVEDDIDIGVPVLGLINFYAGAVKGSEIKLPFDAGIGWGYSSTVTNILLAYTELANSDIIDYYIYKVSDKIYLNGQEIHPVMLYINAFVYPPSMPH